MREAKEGRRNRAMLLTPLGKVLPKNEKGGLAAPGGCGSFFAGREEVLHEGRNFLQAFR